MDKKEMKQALQQIAAEHISAQTDLWPMIAKQLPRRAPASIVSWLPKLGTALVAVLLLLFFLVWLNSLSQWQQTEATTAVLVSQPPATNVGLIFPTAPATLPRYQVVPVAPPRTHSGVLAWAEAFGFANPQLFRDPRSPEQLLVLDENGSRLIFPSAANSNLGVSYLRSDWLELPPGPPLSIAGGTAVATAFLTQHNQLPSRYHIRNLLLPFFSGSGYPVHAIQAAPDLAGYPLLGDANSAQPGALVQMDAAGEVFAASFMQADFVTLAEVTIRPAEVVVDDFVNGRIIPLSLTERPLSTEEATVTQFHPPLPQHEVGESVTILETDDTHFLLSLDGSEHQVVLRTSIGAKYQLLTPDLVQIAETIVNAQLQVSGTIIGQTAPDTWQLEVTSWEILPQQAFLSGCALGGVAFAADGSAWLTAEAVIGKLEVNGRYQIPNLPADINAGDRIEVCSEKMLAITETLAWSAIYRPPRTWHYEGQTADVGVIAQSESPYGIGYTVALTGFVDAVLYTEGETESLVPTFWADLADGSRSHQYRLVGDETVLETLATEQQHHYVQLTGTIVLAEDTAWGEQALEVTAFAQPWPEQQVKAHVGLFSQELYDGTMWTLFTDAADGQAYVLPENGPRFEALLGAEQVWLAGVVHPAYLVNGRPLLRALEALPAQPGETLTVTSHAVNNEPQRWQASAAPSSLEKGDFVIETVELAYFYAPLEKQDVAEPVWVVSGHRRETQTLFVAYLDAVAR